MQSHPRPGRNWKGWAIAGISVAVLILLVVLWGMRPSREGQPGQPGQPAQRNPAASALLVGPDWRSADRSETNEPTYAIPLTQKRAHT